MTHTCDAVTWGRSVYDLYSTSKGGPCSRKATYTDGNGRYFCTQHAKEFATVLKKATNKIRDGLHKIEKVPS